jgi:hypothetical protein
MSTLDRIFRIAVITCVALAVIGVAYSAGSNLHIARERSRQKRTMALMRNAGVAIENGVPVGPMKDAWGFPMQVRVSDVHYSIRSAGSDGRFEKTEPHGYVKTFEADLVFSEGNFVQFPEGI